MFAETLVTIAIKLGSGAENSRYSGAAAQRRNLRCTCPLQHATPHNTPYVQQHATKHYTLYNTSYTLYTTRHTIQVTHYTTYNASYALHITQHATYCTQYTTTWNKICSRTTGNSPHIKYHMLHATVTFHETRYTLLEHFTHAHTHATATLLSCYALLQLSKVMLHATNSYIPKEQGKKNHETNKYENGHQFVIK